MRPRGASAALAAAVLLSALPGAALAGGPDPAPLWREFPLDPRPADTTPSPPPVVPPPVLVPPPAPEPVAAPSPPRPAAAITPAEGGGLGAAAVAGASVLAAMLLGLAVSGPYASRSERWRRRVPALDDAAVAAKVRFGLVVGAGGLGVLVVLVILASL